MPHLGTQKQLLLNQVKNQPGIALSQLVSLIANYDDLNIVDFKGYVSDIIYEQLADAARDSNERQMWEAILAAPLDTPQLVQDAQRLLSTYISRYPAGPKVVEAQEKSNEFQTILAQLIEKNRREEAARREQQDWNELDRGNYTKLRAYKQRYPDSVHKHELDELMWITTRAAGFTDQNLRRYLSDWPAGLHSAEATDALMEMPVWNEIRHSRDIFKVVDYRDSHPESVFKNEVDSLYYELRDEMLKRMKESPTKFSKEDIQRITNANIFKYWELMDEDLITKESWEVLFGTDRDLFPNIADYQIEDPNISAPEGCTDIFLFGTPGTGKTCLLMGLTAANGNGYTLNMKTHGGAYAAALQQYANAGITTGHTYGTFVTVINGDVDEIVKGDKIVSHRINLVEMSGEEFAVRIADNREVSLSNMGTGATNLLKNDNKKVFFIIVDASNPIITFSYLEDIKNADGHVVEQRVRKKYINQLDILNKFVSLFELPENQEIMKKVDAIHFVVTKADMLGERGERLKKAHDLLLDTYKGPVTQLKKYCLKSKRINFSTKYRPQVFTFSLGKFYLGDVFQFDKEETLKIVDTIRIVTSGLKEKTWWDKFKESINPQ